jgi:hypothetical protein
MSRLGSITPMQNDSTTTEVSRKPYRHPESTVGSHTEIIARIIYFDQHRAAELIEDIASTSQGSSLLSRLGGMDSTGVIRQLDRRTALLRLIANEINPVLGEIVELRHTDNGLPRASWNELHPEQAVAITGKVTSTRDVQPSSLRLQVDTTTVRVYVERDHFLHLNRSYLTGLPMTIVVGKVRSVPGTEMCATAIGILPAAARTHEDR